MGVKDVLSRLLLFRVPIFWWCYAFFPVFVAIMAAAINSAVGGNSITFKPLEVFHQWWIVYNFLVAFLLGPLGEEAGWRGFLLPRLLERYSPLMASLMLGLSVQKALQTALRAVTRREPSAKNLRS